MLKEAVQRRQIVQAGNVRVNGHGCSVTPTTVPLASASKQAGSGSFATEPAGRDPSRSPPQRGSPTTRSDTGRSFEPAESPRPRLPTGQTSGAGPIRLATRCQTSDLRTANPRQSGRSSHFTHSPHPTPSIPSPDHAPIYPSHPHRHSPSRLPTTSRSTRTRTSPHIPPRWLDHARVATGPHPHPAAAASTRTRGRECAWARHPHRDCDSSRPSLARVTGNATAPLRMSGYARSASGTGWWSRAPGS